MDCDCLRLTQLVQCVSKMVAANQKLFIVARGVLIDLNFPSLVNVFPSKTLRVIIGEMMKNIYIGHV